MSNAPPCLCGSVEDEWPQDECPWQCPWQCPWIFQQHATNLDHCHGGPPTSTEGCNCFLGVVLFPSSWLESILATLLLEVQKVCCSFFVFFFCFSHHSHQWHFHHRSCHWWRCWCGPLNIDFLPRPRCTKSVFVSCVPSICWTT